MLTTWSQPWYNMTIDHRRSNWFINVRIYGRTNGEISYHHAVLPLWMFTWPIPLDDHGSTVTGITDCIYWYRQPGMHTFSVSAVIFVLYFPVGGKYDSLVVFPGWTKIKNLPSLLSPHDMKIFLKIGECNQSCPWKNSQSNSSNPAKHLQIQFFLIHAPHDRFDSKFKLSPVTSRETPRSDSQLIPILIRWKIWKSHQYPNCTPFSRAGIGLLDARSYTVDRASILLCSSESLK